jgi:hypothetical protein
MPTSYRIRPEPETDFRVVDFLNQAGRGNWLAIERASEPSILGSPGI